jgi:hypothetical protein
MEVLFLITASYIMHLITFPQYYIYLKFKEHSNCFDMHTPSQSHRYNHIL